MREGAVEGVEADVVMVDIVVLIIVLAGVVLEPAGECTENPTNLDVARADDHRGVRRGGPGYAVSRELGV